jgi:hypothetical protein
MIGMVCPYRKCEHRILHPRFLEYVKRHVPNVKLRDSLFVYYHLVHRTIVVAQWHVPCRSFVDVLNIGHSFSGFTPEAARKLLEKLRKPISGHEIAEAIRIQEWERKSNKQDDNDENVEYRTRRPKIMAAVP